MVREDWENTPVCVQCGSANAERGFQFGAAGLLCWTCALERGGRYDAERETWSESPDVSGLPDEAYGATPRERR